MNKIIPSAIAVLFLMTGSASVALAAQAAAPAPKYEVTDGMMLASFVVPVAGKISAWKLHFEFKTQCENDHRIELISPTGRTLTLMERGLNRCSGRSAVFTSDNNDDGGAFVGSSAVGTWKVKFRDLDRNRYTGAMTKFRMDLQIDANGDKTKYAAVLKGLPKKVPNP